jgi:hypothetical protein
MRTIETTATIKPDGTIIAKGPADLPPGEHRVVIVVEEPPAKVGSPTTKFPVISLGAWPANLSLRREDMYGDDGR